MAELSREERERLIPTFLQAYNSKWGTGYRVGDYRDPTDASADLQFTHPEFGELKVQWTTPPMDNSEKRATNQLGRFLNDVDLALFRANLRGVILVLSVRALPRSRDERTSVLAALVGLVEWVRNAHGGGFSQTTIPDWRLREFGLSLCFAEIIVVANMNPSAKPSAIVSPEYGAFVPDSASRARSAVVHKSARYGAAARDLVLVVHFDMDAYFDDEIDEVKKTLRAGSDEFRQVWILRDPAVGEPSAHWVKGTIKLDGAP